MAFIRKPEVDKSFKWSETSIASALSRMFEGKLMVCIPNCSWTGNECDILGVTKDLRIIDIEIKISRSDYKADFSKEKWLKSYRDCELETGIVWSEYFLGKEKRTRSPWPNKVWKHYYCMPSEIWKDGMEDFAGSDKSGIITLSIEGSIVVANVVRHAKPNRDAEKLSTEHVLDIARNASLRMWDAYRKIDR